MRINAVRISLVYFLISLSRFLAFLEGRVFDVVLKVCVAVGLVYVATVNRSLIAASAVQAVSDTKTLVWYETLPKDYFERLEQQSQVALLKYQEFLKPKPPEKTADVTFPTISAKSYIVMDAASDTILSSKNSDLVLPPASTAKLATALASLKLYKLDEEITVPQFCTQVDGTKAGLLQGERFLVGDLLKALLVSSAGDAGCTLSVGKSSYAGFITLMNDVAKEVGLRSTKFTNPIGLDDADGENVTSAEDLAKLGAAAVESDFIKEVVQIKEFNLKDMDGRYSRELVNTNKLLADVPGTVGIKTGTTAGAGEVLVYEYMKDQVDLIIVMMGSTDRFADTKAVLGWVLHSFTWK